MASEPAEEQGSSARFTTTYRALHAPVAARAVPSEPRMASPKVFTATMDSNYHQLGLRKAEPLRISPFARR